MSDIIIGILLVISFFFMVWYCVKGYNLMVGFAIMATVWMGLALVGNTFSPNPAMEGQGVIDVLTHIYTTGPAEYAKSILVNVFFGAFFGRVLVDSGIAATLIRKVVELGGDKPRITMSLLCVVTAVIFMSITGIGPVISIAVIVLPILMSLGISVPVALFSFMGSIMAGIFANIVNFKQYQTIYAGFNPAAESYTYNDYFQIGMIGMVVSLVVVLTVANISMNKKKRYAMAANVPAEGGDAPMISWLAVLLPVLGVVLLDLSIILGFILAGIWALLFTGKLRGGYKEICRQFAKLFTDGAVDVAPMVGFLMTLAMFNNSAAYASPYFSAIFGDLIPQSPLVLAIVFAILTPLGFFRGPMNLVGSGSAILAVVLAVNPTMSPAFLFPLFAITTIAPQHLDITQSWVAWGLGYTKVTSREYMKKSIPTSWIIGAILCLIIFFLYGNA
ncbi:TPA: citrate transporter [Enterococcus faecium]|uniref:citrate transporter n=1 Tax=Enterococcus lactis TaxID=357441 RepID=UPI001A011235|nr:citrate transporter [Enterococcus lactis]EGP5188375.1 citrate transporter [Enterococcus faecium]EGP5573688.1 citrate transporter [Enterococcus faecium]MCW8063443.1 citrate transporter [Enterococcus lactis]MDQ8496397.1 citrate transporter [Enterococcus faecium]MDT2799222.1 citrate transporter [Enterococcus lactis]